MSTPVGYIGSVFGVQVIQVSDEEMAEMVKRAKLEPGTECVIRDGQSILATPGCYRRILRAIPPR